jgi:hypothetical protein
MSIEMIKTATMHRYGLRATNKEAGEIKALAEEFPWASLDEVMTVYYGC